MKAVTAIVVFALWLSPAVAAAQEAADETPRSPYAQGRMRLSGGTSLSLSGGTDSFQPEGGTESESDRIDLSLSLGIGWFVIDGLEVGLTTIGTASRSKDEGDNVVKGADGIIGVHVAYFYEIGTIAPFARILFGIDGRIATFEPDVGEEVTVSASGTSFEAALGVSFVLSERIGLAPEFFFRTVNLSGTDDTSGTDVDFDDDEIRYGLRFGLSVFF